MFVHNFEFRKALKVANKVKEKKEELSWMTDYVILHRRRYLEEINAEEETDELFKELRTNMTFEDLKKFKGESN